MRTQTINLRRGAFGQPSVPFLLSRRAHLLTTPKGRWYFLRKPCALRGGCGSCGSLMSNATALRICCHWPRSWWPVFPPIQNTVALTDGIPPTARINLPLAALFAVMELSQKAKVLRQLFCPRTRHTSIKCVENFWISSEFGNNKPSPTLKAVLQRSVFCFCGAMRPEFQKDEFLVARFPVSSRAFSG